MSAEENHRQFWSTFETKKQLFRKSNSLLKASKVESILKTLTTYALFGLK